jgi:hypothetical protein
MVGFKQRIRNEYVKYRKHPKAYQQRIKRGIKLGVDTGKSIVKDIAGIGKAATEIGAHTAGAVATEGATAPAGVVGSIAAGKRGYKHGKNLVNTIRGAAKQFKALKHKGKSNAMASVQKSSGGGEGSGGQAAASSLDTMQKLSRA